MTKMSNTTFLPKETPMTNEIEEETVAVTAATQGLAYKLVQIAKHCSYVQKTGVNKSQDYKFVTDEAITQKVNDACTTYGVAVFPTDITILETDTVTAKSGSISKRVTVSLKLELVDSETLQRACIVSLGEGMDSGDKAINKALTSARKNAWRIALNIATGNDPEADERTDEEHGGTAPRKVQPQTAATTTLSDIGKKLLASLANVSTNDELKSIRHLCTQDREAGKLNAADLVALKNAINHKAEELTATELS